jgi:hypothetical protein
VSLGAEGELYSAGGASKVGSKGLLDMSMVKVTRMNQRAEVQYWDREQGMGNVGYRGFRFMSILSRSHIYFASEHLNVASRCRQQGKRYDD